jgi:PAS domain S-box-containing protein
MDMVQPLRLLIVEDSVDDATLLAHVLRRAQYEVTYTRVDTPASMRAALEGPAWDVITSDHAMPLFSAPLALEIAKEICPETPFLIVSGEVDLALSVSLMKAGAQDYIPKKELARVVPAIERELREASVRRERQQAEEKIQYQANLIEIITEAIIATDLKNHILSWNAAAETIYGWTSSEVIGCPFAEFIHHEYPANETDDLVRQELLEHGCWRGEVIHSRRNGEKFFVFASITLIRDSQGQPNGMVLVSSDISHRKQTEAERDRLWNHSVDLLCVAGFDGFLKQLNPAWERTLGWTKEELISRPYLEFVHPDDRPATLQSAQSLMEGREIVAFENRQRCEDGTYKWVSWNAFPLVPDKLILAVVHDITEQKQIEVQISAQHDLALALNATADLSIGQRICLETAVRLSEMDCGGIYLLDESSGVFRLVDHQGLSPQFINHISQIPLHTPSAELVMAGNPIYSEHFQLGVPMDDIRRKEGLLATAILPIRNEEKIIGCLNLSSHVRETFPTDKRVTIESVAAQIGSALARLKAESALRESDERLHETTSTLREAIWLRDLKTLAILYVNPAYEEIWGRTCESFYEDPRSFVESIHPDDKERVMAAIQRQYQDEYFNQEYRIVRPDGSLRWVWGRTFPVRNQSGEVYRITAIAEDITERKLANAALEERIRFETLLSDLSTALINIPIDNVSVTIEHGIQQVVDFLEVDRGSLFRLTENPHGFQNECTFAKPGIDPAMPFLSQADFPWLVDQLQKGESLLSGFMREAGPEAVKENAVIQQVKLKSGVSIPLTVGGRIWGAIMFSAFHQERVWPADLVPRLKLIGEVFANALERKRTEEEIRLQNHELEEIGGFLVSISANLDRSAILNEVLQQALALTGLEGGTICLLAPQQNTLQLVAEKNISPAMSADLNASLIHIGDCLCGQVAKTGKALILWENASGSEYATREAVRAEGIRFHAAFPLRAKDRSIGVLCLFSRSKFRPSSRSLELVQNLCAPIALSLDNARLYEQLHHNAAELEQRIRERTAQLEVANQELDAFAHSVSHDLRAPLRIIDGYSKVLQEEGGAQPNGETRNELNRIRATVQYMQELIDSLLELSRLSRDALHIAPVNLSDVARAILDELHSSEPDRAMEIVIEDHIVREADPRLLQIALQNLFGNAWKFTSKREQARIEFGMLSQVDSQPVYFVRDNGAGFDMANAARLFGPFQRLHTNSEFPGNGIGLATAQRIIHRHQGRIWGEGAVNQGATFYFTLDGEKKNSLDSLSS